MEEEIKQTYIKLFPSAKGFITQASRLTLQYVDSALLGKIGCMKTTKKLRYGQSFHLKPKKGSFFRVDTTEIENGKEMEKGLSIKAALKREYLGAFDVEYIMEVTYGATEDTEKISLDFYIWKAESKKYFNS